MKKKPSSFWASNVPPARLLNTAPTPLLIWPLGLRLTDTKFALWLRQAVLPGLLPLAFGVPLWIAGRYWIRPDTWFELCLALSIGAAGFFIGMLWLAMQPEDHAELQRIRGKLRALVRGRQS